ADASSKNHSSYCKLPASSWTDVTASNSPFRLASNGQAHKEAPDPIYLSLPRPPRRSLWALCRSHESMALISFFLILFLDLSPESPLPIPRTPRAWSVSGAGGARRSAGAAYLQGGEAAAPRSGLGCPRVPVR